MRSVVEEDAGHAPSRRACCRCGHPFAGKAGRMVGGRPACPSCANALRASVACVACGRMTKRPGRSPDHDGLVCESCRLAKTHATCATCLRHRRVARLNVAGRPLCAACGANRPVVHPCPDCGRNAPCGGSARCRPCALAHRVARTVVTEAAGLEQDWVRDLFTAFCGWGRLRRERGDMPRHIGSYASFFAAIDRGCGGIGEVTQARLIELHGAEGLRRGHQVVRFLVDRLALSWDVDAVGAATERGRVDAKVAAARDKQWAGDLEAYRVHLAAGRKLAANTTRMYVAAAADLLRASSVGRASELTQRHVARHLRRSPGRTTNLLRFLSWVTEESGQGFEPGRPRRTPPRKREKATLGKAAGLLARLGVAQSRPERRALLAAAIGVVHGMPLSEALALRRVVRVGDGPSPAIGPGGAPVELAGPLAAAFDSLAVGAGALAFPGRNGLQPLSISAVRHHVLKRRKRR